MQLHKEPKPTFPSSFYNEDYFSKMASSVRQLFRETCGKMLHEGKMRFFHLSQIKKGMRLLDIGCGSGEFLMYCAFKVGAESSGIDYSATAIKLAKELCELLPIDVQKRVNLEQRDCINIQHYPDAYFDRIVWFSVIEHLYNWQIKKVVKEAYRILKPNGVFITGTHPNKNKEILGYPVARLILNILQRERKPLKLTQAEGHVNIQSPQGIRRHFVRAGFKVKVLIYSNREFMNYPKWVKVVGHILRNKSPMRWIFGDEIAVIAVKRPQVLQKWQNLTPEFISKAAAG